MKQKILLIRFSSLGDVILATTALGALSPWKSGLEVHWLVAKEFAPVLQQHPWVDRLWVFDRSTGWKGLWQLAKALREVDFRWVYDLHASLRTWLLGLFLERGERPRWEWRTISKQRIRFWGFCLFKRFWPESWRPRPWVERYAQFLGGTGAERPQLPWLVDQGAREFSEAEKKEWPARSVCLMPGSFWKGKCWPVSFFREWVQKSGCFPIVLGTERDASSRTLVQELEALGIPHRSGIGWSLAQSAWALAQSQGYFGNDTGLAHLAEAVGIRAGVLFGPGDPQLGFGPWRKESVALGVPLGCRPCGKSGQPCWRRWEPHACLKRLTPEKVLDAWAESQDGLP